MKNYLKRLDSILDKSMVQYGLGKADTLLEALYQSYCEGRGCDNAIIRNQFQQLDDVLRALSIRQQDQVVDITCRLCGAYQKEAYQDGLLAGFQLYRELSHDAR